MNWHIGIDLGAHGARMAMKGRALALRQSSACALKGDKALALGDDAHKMVGRAPKGVQVVYPMKNGAMDSEKALRQWLSYAAEHCAAAGPVRGARMLIARPPHMALSQMRRLSALALEQGASACALIRSDMAALLGAGVALDDRRGQLLVQVGGGSVSATLSAGMRVIDWAALPYGADLLDDAVARMIRDLHGLDVGPVTAQAVKHSLASAMAGSGLTEPVVGLSLETGFPQQAAVDAAAVAQLTAPFIGQIADMARHVLDGASPQIIEDLMDQGAILTGGGAQIYGLDRQLTEATGIAFKVADDPAGCVARGLEQLLEASDDSLHLLEAHQTLLEKRLSGTLGQRP